MSDVDREIKAIRMVLSALEPLSSTARQSVLEYALRRLQMAPVGALEVAGPAVSTPPTPPPAVVSRELEASALSHEAVAVLHIKQLKEQKKPRSANEMAALVAYYMANLAPQKKGTVNSKDIETQFKIAGFPLPEHVKMTLPNAKNAGYFDLAGNGEYRLNAVGHNLVVHSMPRGGGETIKTSRRLTKRKR